MEMDDVDRRIIQLLSGLYRDIAKRLGASHENFSARIKRLEEGGARTPRAPPGSARRSPRRSDELSEIGRRVAESRRYTSRCG